MAKTRTLTKILRSVGDEDFQDGKTRKERMAELYWQLACTGKVEFQEDDGTTRELKASVKDWRQAVEWIYTHCDGGARIDTALAIGGMNELSETPMDELQKIVAGAVSATMALPSGDDGLETTEE